MDANLKVFHLFFQTSMNVKTQVIILHVMNMPTALILRAVMSVPATLDSLEMDLTALVRNCLLLLSTVTNPDCIFLCNRY